MGTILATPSKISQEQSSVLKEANNNCSSTSHSSKLNLNFSKFNFVHDCLPNLSGKENKFFQHQEKVSTSSWFRSKNDNKKKSKTATNDVYKKLNSASKQKVPQTIENEHIATNTSSVAAAENIQKSARTGNQTQHNISRQQHSSLQPKQHIKANVQHSNLSETMKYLGCFVYFRCRHIDGLKPSVVVSWIKGVDRSLIFSGWQEHGFISESNMIVLYMLLREVITSDIATLARLKGTIMSSLYMCYAYNGHEISYPLKPFLTDGDRAGFWNRCMELINNCSGKMLTINKDAEYYAEVQNDLTAFGRSIERKDG
eukprot:gene3662-4179_t